MAEYQSLYNTTSFTGETIEALDVFVDGTLYTNLITSNSGTDVAVIGNLIAEGASGIITDLIQPRTLPYVSIFDADLYMQSGHEFRTNTLRAVSGSQIYIPNGISSDSYLKIAASTDTANAAFMLRPRSNGYIAFNNDSPNSTQWLIKPKNTSDLVFADPITPVDDVLYLKSGGYVGVLCVPSGTYVFEVAGTVGITGDLDVTQDINCSTLTATTINADITSTTVTCNTLQVDTIEANTGSVVDFNSPIQVTTIQSTSADINITPDIGNDLNLTRGDLNVQDGDVIIAATKSLITDTITSVSANTNLLLSGNGTGVVEIGDELLVDIIKARTGNNLQLFAGSGAIISALSDLNIFPSRTFRSNTIESTSFNSDLVLRGTGVGVVVIEDALKCDTINEYTSGSGVTIDSAIVKDSQLLLGPTKVSSTPGADVHVQSNLGSAQVYLEANTSNTGGETYLPIIHMSSDGQICYTYVGMADSNNIVSDGLNNAFLIATSQTSSSRAIEFATGCVNNTPGSGTIPSVTTPGTVKLRIAGNGTISAFNTTDSSSSTNGAFTIAGGLGVAKSLQVGTNINATGAITSSTEKNDYYQWLGINDFIPVGSWSTVRVTAGVYLLRNSTGTTQYCSIYPTEAMRTASNKGYKLSAIKIAYNVQTVALSSVSAILYRNNVEEGQIATQTTIATTNNLATAISGINEYVKTITITSPIFYNDDTKLYVLEFTWGLQPSTVLNIWGAQLVFSRNDL